MDHDLSATRLIEGIPAHPIGCESSGFVACFTSLQVALKRIPADEHPKHFSKFGVVAGINSLTGDNRLVGYSADDCIKAVGLSDYVDFSMHYAGLSYQETRGSAGEAALYERIVSSINRNMPVLMEALKGWCIVTGFDNAGRLYGYDGARADRPAVLEVDQHLENGLFAVTKWYEQTERIVVVGGQTAPTAHDADVFARMSRIIDAMQSGNYDAALVSSLEDDRRFGSLSPKEVQHLYRLTTSYCDHHASTRAELCWAFDVANHHFGEQTERQRTLMRCICGLFAFTHDLCWNVFRSLGDESYGARDEDIGDFVDPGKRKRIAHWVRLIASNEPKVSVYLKLLADLPVSFLDRYLNEAVFGVPLAEVEAAPRGGGIYDAEVVALAERTVSGGYIPTSGRVDDEADRVYVLDMHEEQGMFYPARSALCGSYTDQGGDEVYVIPSGEYLRVMGALPIAIYNIRDSWYEHHGVAFDWTRRMVIERSQHGQVTAYLPIHECTGVEGPL